MEEDVENLKNLLEASEEENRILRRDKEELETTLHRKEEMIRRLEGFLSNSKSALDGKQFELDSCNRKRRELEGTVTNLRHRRF